MRFRRWLQTWGALIIATIALMFTGYNTLTENARYQEITKPYTQHEEIYDKLVRLDTKIERAKELIGFWASHGDNTTDLQNILRTAETGRNEAEKAWLKNDYSKADNLIYEAYYSLDEIPLPPVTSSGTNWILIIGIAAAAIVIGVIAWVVVRRRVEGYK